MSIFCSCLLTLPISGRHWIGGWVCVCVCVWGGGGGGGGGMMEGMWEGWGRGMEVAILPIISQRLCMIAD